MASLRVNHVVHEPDVVPLPFKAYSLRRQSIGGLFEVISVFFNGRVFQKRLHGRADICDCRYGTVGKCDLMT